MSLDRRAGAPAAPLAGVRVVDFSRLLPGAFCTLLLSDLGAEVIKVEHPRGGDGLRGAAPFTHTGESGAHVVLDRGKRSITLDLKSDDGVRIARALIGTGDVVAATQAIDRAEAAAEGLDTEDVGFHRGRAHDAMDGRYTLPPEAVEAPIDLPPLDADLPEVTPAVVDGLFGRVDALLTARESVPSAAD